KHSISKRIDIKKGSETHWKADCFFTDQYVNSLINRHIQYTILTILGLISVLTVVLILTLNVLVINPVRRITLLLKNIAEGDFSKRFTIKQTDEIGEISSEVNSLMDQLQATFSEIIQNMESVSAGDFSKKITIDLKGDLDKLKSRINGSIEILSDRTEQLKIAQQELVDNAHRAGMADIASGTLHNVGNILNSVKVSSQLISERQENSSISNFIKANNLLRDHYDNLSDFILNNPKGLKLLEYYLKLEEVMIEESTHMKENLHRLNDKIDAITDVISAQQSFAGVSSLSEEYMLSDIVENALTLQIGSIERYGIKVIKKYSHLPKLLIQKTKLIHIIINLIKNARESMIDTPVDKRKISISITKENNLAYLKIGDSGLGISERNLKKIFNHGFTTKKEGHGFGLHSCANYMTEMGGKMWAESEGQGKGATFILEFKLPT
ncbi:HAMP domain-containing protein, partial [bacterium]|nr:HAMP domain-containing protein [bacterium]